MTERSMLILRGVGLLTLIGLGAYALSPKKNTKGNNGKARNNPRIIRILKEEDIPEIKLLIAQGLTRAEIAKIFGVDERRLSSFLVASGLSGVRRLQSREALLKEKVAQGLSESEICADLGLTKTEIRNRLTKMGIDYKTLGKPKESLELESDLESDSSEIVEEFVRKRKSLTVELSPKFRLSKSTIPYEVLKPYIKAGLEPCEICEFLGVTEYDVRASVDDYISKTIPQRTRLAVDRMFENGLSQVSIAISNGLTLDKLDEYYKEHGYPIPTRLVLKDVLKIKSLRITKKTNTEIAEMLGITVSRLIRFYEPLLEILLARKTMTDNKEFVREQRIKVIFANMYPYILENYEYFQIEEILGLSRNTAANILDEYIEAQRPSIPAKAIDIEYLKGFLSLGFAHPHLCILTGMTSEEMDAFLLAHKISQIMTENITARDLDDVKLRISNGDMKKDIASDFDISTVVLRTYLKYYQASSDTLTFHASRSKRADTYEHQIKPPQFLTLILTEEEILERDYGLAYKYFQDLKNSRTGTIFMPDLNLPPQKAYITEASLKQMSSSSKASIRDIAQKLEVSPYEVVRLFAKYSVNIVDKF